MNKVKVSDIKENPKNPRFIKNDKLKKLMASIEGFPEMLELRPIVLNKDYVVLGGNMRLQACKKLGIEAIVVPQCKTINLYA
jgi:ParB-like chromosome segregation protein Spo0J